MSKRILIKLSGEALKGNNDFGFDEETITNIAHQIKDLISLDMEIAIVTGGGNFLRGRDIKSIERTKADTVGMMATVMNCMFVSEIFKKQEIDTNIYTPFNLDFTKRFNVDDVDKDLKNKKVVFFAGGTGHPFFSTDSITVLRALEIKADIILLGKSVDGIYDSDPKINKNAKRFDRITLSEIINKKLTAIDLSSAVMALENKMNFFIFELSKKDSIKNAALGKIDGTLVTYE